ncbi:uncharacterized protein J7T54_003767 [Emericellopsis cladophorae]|uniref:Myb-like DNA-binding domain-containing protein n=1 Tax=Emericellopsis cladophorae TaxID=2686198 RepID=A0A9P9XYA3_9HYPO|nr:uncharacterized protein J7T54_003767 [Emericellopsis cladophorae]KAI6779843.1 hypothetical protein J7T54_003767 [Emericellopsis cladophorae]
MSPNSDNAMARFLFAILKQKNLKDIDWNQVAEDPVLLQPISNGHAARMRYSRFRATVSNADRRSPSSSTGAKSKSMDKNRVSKAKSKKDGPIKVEQGRAVKQEFTQLSLSNYSPASGSAPSPYLSDHYDDFTTRFLTPCSDDMGNPNLAINPSAIERPPGPQTFSPALDFMQAAAVHNLQSPTFSAFDEAAFDMNTFMTSDSQSAGPNPSDEWHDRIHHQF